MRLNKMLVSSIIQFRVKCNFPEEVAREALCGFLLKHLCGACQQLNDLH